MKTLEALELITQVFLQANVAVPIVSGTVMAIASIIRGVTGGGPSLAEIADMIEDQVGANDETIRAEIARLETKTGN